MIKGVAIAFAVIVLLALIPIVHFGGIPFGPFIGGYYGISSVGHYPGSIVRKAAVFGLLFGLLMLIVFAVAALIVTMFSGFSRPILWGGVAVFTFYYASMSFLGAWYAELRAAA